MWVWTIQEFGPLRLRMAACSISTGISAFDTWAWVFTKLLPFSNIAWRVAVSCAAAGALACGVIAFDGVTGRRAHFGTRCPTFRD